MSENIDLLNEIEMLKAQIVKLKEEQKPKKRKKGTYQLNSNGTARLQFMFDGKRYSETVEAQNEKEAEAKLALFIEAIETGKITNCNFSLTEFTQIWLDKKVRPNSDANICPKKYISYLNNRVLPTLGDKKLNKITRLDMEDFFNTLKKSKTLYKNRENTTIKPGSVEKIKSILNAIFNYAIELDLIYKNPCKGLKIKYDTITDDIKYIKEIADKKLNKINYYNVSEFKKVHSMLEDELIYYYNSNINDDKKLREVSRRILILIDLNTGMRRSELFGLAKGEGFDDLNINDKTFYVNKSRHYAKGVGKYTKATKNPHSIRKKSIPEKIIPYIEIFFNLLKEINYNNIYLFDSLSIDSTSGNWWDKWQDEHGIRNIRFHDIRHTHATILLRLGVDMKTISERLGHADISETFNTYADVLKELDSEASSKLDYNLQDYLT